MEEVRAALATPSRYYSEFLFFDRDDETMLRVTFQKSAIMELVRASELPVWYVETHSPHVGCCGRKQSAFNTQC